MRRSLTISLLAFLCLSNPAQGLRVGIADQKGDMFSDQRFLGLGITDARRAVSWDALEVSSQAAEVDSWLRAARAAGVTPLISFDRSRRKGHERLLPSVQGFRHQFARFHARYGWVRDFATWNEANFCGQITCHHPERVAAYFHVMRTVCPTCTILGAELLDLPNMIAWQKGFVRAAHMNPYYWGLHNYVGANHFSTASTRALLAATKGEVWFTETAGLVARHNRSPIHFPPSPGHAAEVTQFIFSALARLSPRVARVYLYQWDTLTLSDRWDSALIDRYGRERPAFRVLQRVLAALGIGPAARLPTVAAATPNASSP